LENSYDDSEGPPETETLRIAPLSPPATRGLDHSLKGIQLRSLYCKLTVSKRRLLEDNSAPIDGSPAGIERRKLRWKQIHLLKQVIAGLTSVEGAIAAPEGYVDSIQAIYAFDTPIQALLTAHSGIEQSKDSQGVYINDEGKSEPEAHIQTQGVHTGGTLSDSGDTEEIRGDDLALAPPFDSWANPLDIPPGLGPMDSYFFATDGSVDEEVGRGGYASVTPHTIDGWSPHPSGKYSSRSKGVACYGAEAIAVDTCELMAVVDVLENGPQANLTLLVDASYIMFGFNAHPSGIRRQVRRTNRALWLRANSALNQRIEQGFFVRFRKCSSHNQDSNQHQLVTLWNDRADTEAKAGCRSKTDLIKEWVPDGDFSFQLLARGKLVRGDPRSHIGRAAAANSFTHAETLKDGGILPALISEVPCGISLGTLYRTRSAVQLARAGVLELQSFAFCLQNFALRTPSREYLSKEVDWTKLRSHLPRENKKCICPLCGDAKPDTWHYSTQCSFTDNLRAETQAATGALLTGICSLGVHDPNFPNILAAWFQHNFMDITGPDAVEICNATAGSGSPANALHWDGTVDWPLMLCSTKTLSNFLKLPGRPESTVLLIVPAGRFPKGVSSLPVDAKPTDIPQTLFEEEEV
jgi:hypothetical protein